MKLSLKHDKKTNKLSNFSTSEVIEKVSVMEVSFPPQFIPLRFSTKNFQIAKV